MLLSTRRRGPSQCPPVSEAGPVDDPFGESGLVGGCAQWLLTEAYASLGLDSEAQTAAAVLGANYPGSAWYQNAYGILRGRNLSPQENRGSWISQAFRRIL